MSQEAPQTRPADAAEFLRRQGRLQGWDLFSPDNQIWCVVNSEGEPSLFRPKKTIWVWISGAQGSNRATLFEHRYTVNGRYVLSATHWLSNEPSSVEIYDYGRMSLRSQAESLRSNHIMSIRFSRDKQIGRFIQEE